MKLNRRKHFTQMSVQETDAVGSAVRKINNLEITPYVRGRMAERNIKALDIAKTLRFGHVIEVHNNIGSEIRVLMQAVVNNKKCHAVVSLTNRTLVTCYWNSLNDSHATLDKSAYKWNVNLLDVVR